MTSIPSQPLPPLPEPLRGVDPLSFAFKTLSSRLPGIARRVLAARAWQESAGRRLQALADDMPYGTLRLLDDPLAPDAAAWQADLAPYLGLSWLEAPWYVSETYFFRRVLEATGYYQPGPGFMLDPYLPEKQQELEALSAQAGSLCEGLASEADPDLHLPASSSLPGPRSLSQLGSLLRRNIWGNQADRSMWPARSQDNGPLPHTGGAADDHLLVDDSHRLLAFLAAQPLPLARLDLVLDNGGLELAYDLVLSDYLLSEGFARAIRLHAKSHPTYVSDVHIPDLSLTLEHFEQSRESCVRSLAARLRTALADGRLQRCSDYYWTSLRSGWEMPAELQAELGEADLVISKGDANYRRWLGDRLWPHTTPIDQILAYFPSPLLIMRVLKANLVAGLEDGLSEKMYNLDPEWLHNGSWGLIQAAGLDRLRSVAAPGAR